MVHYKVKQWLFVNVAGSTRILYQSVSQCRLCRSWNVLYRKYRTAISDKIWSCSRRQLYFWKKKTGCVVLPGSRQWRSYPLHDARSSGNLQQHCSTNHVDYTYFLRPAAPAPEYTLFSVYAHIPATTTIISYELINDDDDDDELNSSKLAGRHHRHVISSLII